MKVKIFSYYYLLIIIIIIIIVWMQTINLEIGGRFNIGTLKGIVTLNLQNCRGPESFCKTCNQWRVQFSGEERGGGMSKRRNDNTWSTRMNVRVQ